MAPANLTPSDLVCNGNTGLAGIGRDAAAQIWYRALTVYMTSNTDYAGARVATLNAAADLYGAGSAQLHRRGCGVGCGHDAISGNQQRWGGITRPTRANASVSTGVTSQAKASGFPGAFVFC